MLASVDMAVFGRALLFGVRHSGLERYDEGVLKGGNRNHRELVERQGFFDGNQSLII